MTNAELIEKIRTEIERRRLHFNKEAEKYQAINNGYSQNCYGARDALRDLENFLSTLESERPEPYNPVYDEAYLNEKIKKATESWKGVDVDAMLAECRGYDEEKSEKPMNQDELIEEVKRYYSENFDYISSDQPTLSILTNIARHFYELGQQSKEQPLCEDFDLESDRFFRKLPLRANTPPIPDEYIDEETFDRIARHFAKWGAEHLKK